MELIYKIASNKLTSIAYSKDESPICAVSNQNIIAITSHRSNFTISKIQFNKTDNRELVLYKFMIY